jgi:hypothetical protein
MVELARFPFYINSKGRPDRQLTANALLDLGITPTLVVEDAEHDAYAAANPRCPVIVWPQSYMDNYEKTPGMDPHPTTGVGRNYAWDHSREQGFERHWILDDNIRRFRVIHEGTVKTAVTQTPLAWVEHFAERWTNLGGVCLGQTAFGIKPKTKRVIVNTRLYCASLLTNEMADQGLRWRRGYNEDTITSIDILKTGYWCTAQIYSVTIDKIGTSRKGRLDGGMTQFYANGGFIRKANELVRVHPDCCEVINRYQRVHHYCHYNRFRQRLIPVGTPSTGTVTDSEKGSEITGRDQRDPSRFSRKVTNT